MFLKCQQTSRCTNKIVYLEQTCRDILMSLTKKSWKALFKVSIFLINLVVFLTYKLYLAVR